MLNVNELTSRMAKMSDAQLRQYAQLHKNDPYTLALAASESKRRAQLRASGQPQAPQQPTVADQALAQMGAPAPMPQQAQPRPQLPEQQGIGMLPAENVEGMADGGIAGYDDQFVDSYADAYAHGGIVAFAGNDGSVVRDAPDTPFWQTSLGSAFSENARKDLDKGEYKTSPVGRFFSFLTPDAYTTDTRNRLVDIDKKYSVLRNEYKNLTGVFGFKSQSPQQQARANELEKQMNALEEQAAAIRGRPDATVRSVHERQVAEAKNQPSAPTTTGPATYVDSSTVPSGWAVKGTRPGKRVVDRKGNVTFVPGEQSRAPKSINEYEGTDLSYRSPWSGEGSGGPFANTAEGRAAAARRPGKEKKAGEEQGPPTSTTEQKIQGPAFTPGSPGDLNAELAKVKPMFGDLERKYDDLLKANQEFYTGFQKEREATRPKGKAFEGLEGLLAKEEEKAKGKEARNFNMAIVNAGLAIAGGRSQYALQNIAEGAQVGTKQYQEGLEKLEAAAIERRKQNAMIEEARRAEARGDWKEDLALRQSIHNSNLAIRQNQIEGIAKITGDSIKVAADRVNTLDTLRSADVRALMQQQAETERETFKQLQENIRTEKQIAGQKDVATIYANRPLGGGAGVRGQITPALLFKAYEEASKPRNDPYGDFKKQYPTFQHYMLAQEVQINPTVTDKPPQNATVRK